MLQAYIVVTEEKIEVKSSLDNTSDPDNDVWVMVLVCVAVDPIDDVESTVQAEQCHCEEKNSQ